MTEGKRQKRLKKQSDVNGDGRSGSPNGEDEPDGEIQVPEKKDAGAAVSEGYVVVATRKCFATVLVSLTG